MTPGRAAELWRRPIKLFAFDLILSFLPPRWMCTGEHTEKNRHTPQCCHIVHIALLLAFSTYAFPVSFYPTQICAQMHPIFYFHIIWHLHLVLLHNIIHKTRRRGRVTRTKNKKNKKNWSIFQRRWWWNNYVKTVLPVTSSAYQVIVWCYKFHPCRQPQFLPLFPKLKVAHGPGGSGRNTFAHTCALFISNRCWVEGPV